MEILSKKMDAEALSQLMQKQLTEVSNMLAHKRSTMETLHSAPVTDRVTFTIQVENKSVKKDRQAYIAALEKEKQLERKKRVKGKWFKSSNKAVPFTGAPFSSQAARFKPIGIHPTIIKRESFINNDYASSPPCGEMCQGKGKQKHYIDSWKPENYYKDMILTQSQRQQKAKAKELESARGPGCYGIPKLCDGPAKDGGQMRSRRFDTDQRLQPIKRGRLHNNALYSTSTVPGPGAYSIVDKHQSCDIREGEELFTLARSHDWPRLLTGSGLPPGTHYTDNDSLASQARKQVGTRGPYNTFTTSRWDAINTGSPNFRVSGSSSNPPHLGPGTYNPQYTHFHAKADFKKMTLNQEHSLKNKSVIFQPIKAKKTKTPGPGTYNLPPLLQVKEPDPRLFPLVMDKGNTDCVTAKTSMKARKWKEKYGFLSSTKKRDKVTTDKWKFETGDKFIGPARYDTERYDNIMRHQGHSSGYPSTFSSTTPQSSLQIEADPQQVIMDRHRKILERNRGKLLRFVSRQSNAVSRRHG